MLIRILVAVLTLVGSLPLRVCTCAATTVPTPAPVRMVVATPTHSKHCHCNHSTKGIVKAERAAHPELSKPVCGTPHHSHGNGHAPDCQSVSPQPVVRDAATVPSAVEQSQADVELPAMMIAAPSHASHQERIALASVGQSVPRYLSLLVLRI